MASRAFVIAFCLASPAFAQGPEAAGVRGDSGGTRRQLAEAEQLLKADKPSEARKLLSKILDESGDDLILVEGGRYVAARWYTQRLLARLPEDELKLFRTGIDDAANNLLDEGRSRRDSEPLQELIARYFVSRAAADALALLGELAFERGEFELAEYYWARLLTDEDRPPGPFPNLPSIAARRILAIHFQGDTERTWKLFQEFSKAYADATGRLAGRDGKLADILQDELQRPRKPQSAQSSANDWPTLGGSANRTGIVPGSISRLPVTPLWSVPIPGRGEGGPIVNAVRRVGFHPILNGSHVFLADSHRIHRFDFADGKLNSLFDDAPKGQSSVPSQWQNADFTLTKSHGRIYARIGAAGVLPGDANRKTAIASRLIGVPLNENRTQSPRILAPPVGDDAIAGWEGAPLAADGNLFAAFTRLDGGRLVQAIACYDDRNPKPHWVTDVCEAAVAEAEGRERQELLTAAGPNVVFCSQSGVIAAVNRRTGKPAWSYRYQRIPKVPFDGRPRDLSPPVAAGSRVFVAPNDSDKLFAFDAESGRLLWQSGPIFVDHLIGIANGKVIAAIAGPQRGLRAYHAATGSCDPPLGWMQHDDPMLATFGRGLIAGDLIAWPTQAGLYLIRLEDGLPARPLLRDVHGNLAYADGKLAVADAKTLSLFAWLAAGPVEPAAKPITKLDFKPIEPIRNISITDLEMDYVYWPHAVAQLLKDGENPKIEAAFKVNNNQYLLLPHRNWAKSDNELSLYVTQELGDIGRYLEKQSVISRGSVLSLKTANQTLWSQDLRLPIHGVRISAEKNIIVQVGENGMVCLDAMTAAINWILDSRKRNLLFSHAIQSGPCFDREFIADRRSVMVRITTNVCWLIDAKSGSVIAEWPAKVEWKTPPVMVAPGLIAFAAGPGTIRAVDTVKKVILWTFDAQSPAGLTGIGPQFRVELENKPFRSQSVGSRFGGSHLFALISRNHGFELECLVDGRSIWNQPAFLGTEAVVLADAGCRYDSFFVPAASQVISIRRVSGEIAWKTPLPHSARWIVHPFADYIALVPRSIIPCQLRCLGVLLGNSPIRLLLNLLVNEPTPILLLDPVTGKVRHNLKFPHGPIVASAHTATGLWLATPQTIYRVK